MIRLSKLADYAIQLLTYFSPEANSPVITARELSEQSALPLPTVSKILKSMCRGGVLRAHRGKNGGYSLVHSKKRITLARVITIMDGPIALTECADDSIGACNLERSCPVQGHWQLINQAVYDALSSLSIADLDVPVTTFQDCCLNQPAERASAGG